jgi:hypothetical protein
LPHWQLFSDNQDGDCRADLYPGVCLRLREVCAGVAVSFPGDRLVLGAHITDQQVRLYMHHRTTQTR